MKKLVCILMMFVLLFSCVACSPASDDDAKDEVNKYETNKDENNEEQEKSEGKTLTVEGGKYKLAAIMPMTGALEWYGNANINGMKLAIKHWNEEYGGINGHPVELVVFDDRGDPNESVNCANMICDAKDEYIACNGSFMPNTTMAICPVFQKNELILYSAMGSHKDVCTAGDYVFTMANVSKIEILDYAKVVFDEVGGKNVGVIAAQSDMTTELDTVFEAYSEKCGAEVFFEYYIADSTTDYSPILTSLFENDIDTIVISSDYSTTATIYLQAYDMGLIDEDVKVVCTGQCASEEFLTLLGSAGDGVIVTTTAPVYFESVMESMDASDTLQRFIVDYVEEFNAPANAFAGQSYDTVMAILGGVVELGTTDSDELKNVMMDLCGVDEPVCAEWLDYDQETRQLIKPAAVYEIVDNEFVIFNSGIVEPSDEDIAWATKLLGY